MAVTTECPQSSLLGETVTGTVGALRLETHYWVRVQPTITLYEN